VDVVLHLALGTVARRFREEDGFRPLVLHERWKIQKGAAPDVDYGAGLSPKQRRAALLLAQGMNQKESAAQVGVDARTIRNWNNDPMFGKFVRQVEEFAANEDREQRAREEAAFRARVVDLRSLAADVNKEDLLNGGVRSAQMILKDQLWELGNDDHASRSGRNRKNRNDPEGRGTFGVSVAGHRDSCDPSMSVAGASIDRWRARARSCMRTLTPSTPRSNSATTRRCAAAP
jgi:hypothetical protein